MCTQLTTSTYGIPFTLVSSDTVTHQYMLIVPMPILEISCHNGAYNSGVLVFMDANKHM